MHRQNRHTRKQLSQLTAPVAVQSDTLENRALLTAVVVEAVQIDNQAPDVLVDSGNLRLLYLQDADSTRLFSTDGTQAGTTEIREITGLFDTHDVLGTVGGRVIFRVAAESTLWSSDGTVDGTISLKSVALPQPTVLNPGASPKLEAAEYRGMLYFSADGGDGFELWRTDGTFEGTRQVHDINRAQIGRDGHSFYWDAVPGAVSYDISLRAYGSDYNAGNFGDHLTDTFFTQNAVTSTWLEVPVDVSTIVTSGAGQAVNPGHFLMTTTPNFDDGSQGGATTQSVRITSTIDQTSSHPSDFVVFNDALYFAAEDPLVGREIFKTDGINVSLAVEAAPGKASTDPARLLEFDGRLFFGSNGDHGLYRTDGTTAGTVRIAEGAGASHVWGFDPFDAMSHYSAQQMVGSFPIAVVNGKLIAQQMGNGEASTLRRLVSFSSATDDTPTDLGITGSGAVFAPYNNGGSYFDGFTVVNDRLIFRHSSYSTSTDGSSPFGHLLATDGNTTAQLFDNQIWYEHHSGERVLDSIGTAVGTEFYFTALTRDRFGGAGYSAAFRTDGTVANSATVGTTDYLSAGSFNRATQYLHVGTDTYYLQSQSTDTTAPVLWDLYQIHSGAADTLIDDNLRFDIAGGSPLISPGNDTQPAEFFEFNDALFMKLATDDGEALFTIGDGPDDSPITVTGGIGLQTTATPTFTWNAPSGDVERYDLFINTVGNRSASVYRRTNLTATTHVIETQLSDGTYEVWLRAYYSDGTVTRWGREPGLLNQSSGQASSGPPSITSPAAVSELNRPTFRWTATQDAVSYEIWISDNTSTTPLIRQSELLSTSFTPLQDLSTGAFRVWVRAKLADSVTDWSVAKRFQIQHAAIVPTGGVGSQPGTTPTITWNDPGNVERFEIFIQEDGATGPVYRRTDLTTSSHTLETPLRDGGQYTVWLRGHFNDGSTSRWGTTGAGLNINVEVGIITPRFPMGVVDDDRPTFIWSALGSDADRYELRVGLVGSGDYLIEATIPESASVRHDDAESYTHNSDLPDGQYVWQVRVILDSGNVSEWTSAEAFTIPVQPPNITGGVGGPGTSQPTITWTEVADVRFYDLYIGGIESTSEVYRRANLTETSHTLATELADGSYNVWIRAVLNDGSATGWGEPQKLYIGDSEALTNIKPELTVTNGRASWTPVQGSAAYEIHVDGKNPFDWRVLYSNTLGGTNLNLPLPAGTYRGWIRALGPNGEPGRFSDWTDFEIVSHAAPAGSSTEIPGIERALEIQLPGSIEPSVATANVVASPQWQNATTTSPERNWPIEAKTSHGQDLSTTDAAMLMANGASMAWLDEFEVSSDRAATT